MRLCQTSHSSLRPVEFMVGFFSFCMLKFWHPKPFVWPLNPTHFITGKKLHHTISYFLDFLSSLDWHAQYYVIQTISTMRLSMQIVCMRKSEHSISCFLFLSALMAVPFGRKGRRRGGQTNKAYPDPCDPAVGYHSSGSTHHRWCQKGPELSS